MENPIKPGTEVKFKKQFGAMHNGIIKAVWLAESGVQYQIAFFNQGILQEPYVPRQMFDVVEHDPIPAGFRLPPCE